MELSKLFGYILLVACGCLAFTEAVGSDAIGNRLAPHYVQDVPPSASLEARQARPRAYFRIKGVQDGTVQNRMELRDFTANKDLLNVFLLGLERMQATDQQDQLSYYQIAGIHGLPYDAWDGVAPRGSQGLGYCMHYSNLFIPWHRPYVALYEQILYSNIQAVVAQYQGADKAKYTPAAAIFRLPYWDWLKIPPSGQSNFPPILEQDTIEVYRPNGTTQTIHNPLSSYKFHPLNVTAFSQVSKDNQWIPKDNETKRSPACLQPDCPPNYNAIRGSMDLFLDQMRDRSYRLWTSNRTYQNVSNAANNPNPPTWELDSFELIHGWAHTSVGGTHGHMTPPEVSAFDPVFMFHHCQVDRVVALWQALHPETYVEARQQDYPTFAFGNGPTTVLDGDAPLYPFHSDPNTYWTANSARNHTAFGYNFAELTGDATSLRAYINQMYGNQPVLPSTTNSSSSRILPRARMISTIADYNEYIMNVRIDQFAVDGPFTVFLFLGDHCPDPSKWENDENLIGAMPVFTVSMHMKSMMKIAADDTRVIGGTISVTRKLQQLYVDGDLNNLDETTVVNFLKGKIKWAVRKNDGTLVPLASIPSLKLSFVSEKIRPGRTPDAFPSSLGDRKVHSDVTSNQVGGLTAYEASVVGPGESKR